MVAPYRQNTFVPIQQSQPNPSPPPMELRNSPPLASIPEEPPVVVQPSQKKDLLMHFRGLLTEETRNSAWYQNYQRKTQTGPFAKK